MDEIQYGRGHQYLTLVYQIESSCTRLLWVGKERTTESFQQFFTVIGGGTDATPTFRWRISRSRARLVRPVKASCVGCEEWPGAAFRRFKGSLLGGHGAWRCGL